MTMASAGTGRFGAAFDRLGVEHAWTRTRGSPDVVIGIVDRGVQLDHPLLGPNIRRDLVPPALSADSHEINGTHAAGVAAGRHSDADDFSGVAPDSRLLPVRFHAEGGPQELDLAHAIEYAVERGACIVNISAAGDLSRPATQRAVQYAATRNVLVVCAAAGPADPAIDETLPNLLRVLPVGEDLAPLPDYSTAVAHLAAPAFARVPHWRGSGHAAITAAGLGAPYVSGCAALVRALNPGWGYHEIKEHLMVSGVCEPGLSDRCRDGRVLHVANAVRGPLAPVDGALCLSWSSLNDAELRWTLRYRASLCAQVVALYRPHGDQHWRELAFARAGALRMTIPAEQLRRSTGTLRLACRDSNFHCDDVELTIR
jgi:hypothetical protein